MISPAEAVLAPSGAGAAGEIRIRIVNRGEAPLFIPTVDGGGSASYEIEAPGIGAIAAPESLFCPTPCPQSGPVMEVDCRRPVPAVAALAGGSTLELVWSGEIAAGFARACDAGGERQCFAARRAKAGEYRVTVCAFADSVPAARRPVETGVVPRTRPSGAARCASAAFSAPRTDAVELPFD